MQHLKIEYKAYGCNTREHIYACKWLQQSTDDRGSPMGIQASES